MKMFEEIKFNDRTAMIYPLTNGEEIYLFIYLLKKGNLPTNFN